MLYIHEIRKILYNKVSLILLSILFVFNIFTLYLNLDDNEVSHDDIANIIEIYNSDKTEYYKIYNNLQSSYQEAIANSYVFESFDFSSTKSQTDYALFEVAHKYISFFENYPSRIQSVIKEAQLRKIELERKNENLISFSYIYQNTILDIYNTHTTILSTDDIFHYGWEDFFEYDIINIFTFVSIIVLGGQLINIERTTGMLPIIGVTKNGRRHLIFIKIFSACTIAIILTLAFNFSSLLFVYLNCGLSDFSSPIQIIPSLSFVPWSFNIIDAFLVLLFTRCLASLALILFVFLLSIFFEYLLTYLISLIILSTNLLISLTSSSIQFKYCNLFSFTSFNFLSRYRSFWFIDDCVELFSFTLQLYIVIVIIILSLLIMQKDYSRKNLRSHPTLRTFNAIQNLRFSSFNVVPIHFFHNIYYSEILKHKFTFALVFIVLLIRIILSLTEPFPVRAYSDLLYQEYMEQLYGEFTPEKLEFVLEEKKYIANILSQETSMRIEYELGNIDETTYRQYQKEFFYCSERSTAINKVYSHTLYLEKAASSNEFIPIYFYDTGLAKLFDTSLDPYIIIIIFILCGSIFRPEYLQTSSSSSCCNIIRTTQKGRWHSYYSKYILCILSVFLIVLSVTICDIVMITSQYHILEYNHIIWNADIRNIEAYNNCFITMNCGSYYVLTYILRFLGYLTISSICFFISNLCERSLQTYGVIMVLTLIPLTLFTIGIDLIFAINILSICNPNELFLTSKHFYIPYLFTLLLLVIFESLSNRKWN